MNSHKLKQTYNVYKTQKLRYLVYDFVYFFEKFPDDFAQNLPQCTRLSIRAMEKKIKHDIGRPPPLSVRSLQYWPTFYHNQKWRTLV